MTGTVHSFDVFDTVLTRLVGDPSAVFLLVGHRAVLAGYWRGSAERFRVARLVAESRARSHAFPFEVSLREIYSEFEFAQAMDTDASNRCATLEVQLEGELLRVVPAARQAIELAHRQGMRVAFISDMYLPATDIRHWLERDGLAGAGDQVLVSSESRFTKASGSLFRDALQVLGEPPTWRHFGDNHVSDVSMPRSLGIESTHWPACLLTRYEGEMELHSRSSGALSSLLAGGARWLRLSASADNAVQDTHRNIAAGVAGPVLWAFVTWVLRTAQREGLGKVWFTARDGQVMLRMARRIAPKLGIDLDMGYLYGGRQVVHLAGLHQIDERALKWLTGGAGVITTEALLERVGLRVEQLADALGRHGIPLDGMIGWHRMPALQAFFLDPAVQSAVLGVAASRRADMRDYFSACGLIGNEPCAVVDIGWRGSVLRSMFDILGAEHGARHHFLYFGLFGRPSDVPEARMSAYCFDLSGSTARGTAHNVPSLMAVMEIFCQADHPQVVHVERRLDGHVPVLRRPPSAGPTLWNVDYFQSCLEAFADTVRVDLAVDADADLRTMCERLLRMLMETPDEEEARVLGSVQYVDDQSGTTSQPFAHAYGLRDLRETARTGALPRRTLAWWTQGAWTLTTPSMRILLRAARRIGRWRQRRESSAAAKISGAAGH